MSGCPERHNSGSIRNPAYAQDVTSYSVKSEESHVILCISPLTSCCKWGTFPRRGTARSMKTRVNPFGQLSEDGASCIHGTNLMLFGIRKLSRGLGLSMDCARKALSEGLYPTSAISPAPSHSRSGTSLQNIMREEIVRTLEAA